MFFLLIKFCFKVLFDFLSLFYVFLLFSVSFVSNY